MWKMSAPCAGVRKKHNDGMALSVQILLLLIGLALIVFGADILVDGASAAARRFGISEFIIGLTIVGMGTSAPEMVVSFLGAVKGNADIAVGNVVGSNIFNTLLILGVTAVIMPITVTRTNLRRDIPVNLVVTSLLILFGMKATLFGIGTDGLGRFEGAMLLALFVAYLVLSFKKDAGENESPEKEIRPWIAAVMVVGGLAALIGGGELFVDAATSIAETLGISDKFIAITLLAGGTSMPELATCIVAAAKKKGQLALGNILGSNVFNILLVLGGSALIHPLSFASINLVDMGILLVSAILVLVSAWSFRRNELDRFDGILFLLCGIAYFIWLFINL